MNSVKIHTAGIEKDAAEKLLYGYDSCGVDISITDNDTVLTLEIAEKGGFSLSNEQFSAVKNTITARLGQNLFNSSQSLQENVVELLKLRGMKLATAESCTSGIISSKITEINGASSVFDFGISAYSNEIKMNALNVSRSVLDKYGAVSSQTAAQMAIGAMRISGADIGLSVTGVAGPMTSEGKPVGLIYLGMCDRYGLWVLKLNIDGDIFDREQIRERAANIALDFVRRYLSFEDFGAVLYRGGEEYCTLPHQIASFSVSDKIPYPEFVLEDLSNLSIVDVTDYAMDETDSDYYSPITQSIPDEKPINRRRFGFLRKILPWSGDSTSDLIRKMIAVVLCCLSFILSLWLILDFTSKESEVKQYQNLYTEYLEKSTQAIAYNKDENGIFYAFSDLYGQNSDICGWITNPSKDICSPVMRSDYEYYYSNHSFFKKPSGNGTVYYDANCDLSGIVRSQNIILYGNNAANGTVFGNLDNYLNIEYYINNPTLRFDTLYERGEYVIVSVVKLENIQDFNYRKTDFSNFIDSGKYISEFTERSIYKTNLTVSADSKLLTLVTNTDENGRILVLARPIVKGDDLNNLNIEINIPVK